MSPYQNLDTCVYKHLCYIGSEAEVHDEGLPSLARFGVSRAALGVGRGRPINSEQGPLGLHGRGMGEQQPAGELR